jgi:hypothetical protein
MWAVRRRALRCCMGTTALAAGMAGGVSAQTPAAPSTGLDREAASIRITPENVRLTSYLRPALRVTALSDTR